MQSYSLAIILAEQQDIKSYRREHLEVYTPPHITLVYPFEKNFFKHAQQVLSEQEPFTIVLNNIGVSAKEYYLYLLPEKDEVLHELHEKLHTGILAHHANADMPTYIPHLTLGVFNSQTQLQENVQVFKQVVHVDKMVFLTHDDSGSVVTTQEILLAK